MVEAMTEVAIVFNSVEEFAPFLKAFQESELSKQQFKNSTVSIVYGAKIEFSMFIHHHERFLLRSSFRNGMLRHWYSFIDSKFVRDL